MPMIELRAEEEALLKLARDMPVKQTESEVYYVQGERIVGIGRIVTRSQGVISVVPKDEAAKAFFADDYTVAVMGEVWNMTYLATDGEPWTRMTDEPHDRHKGTTVVGKSDFDLGLSAKRFAGIAGFGRALKP